MSLHDDEKAGPLATGPALKIEVVERHELRRKKRKPQANAVTPQARWRQRNPIAAWCHSATASAIRRGIIERQPCEVCGDPKTDAHHPEWKTPLFCQWLAGSIIRRPSAN
ncbi:hypothetical protein [Mesorhizobium sp. LjNodule214]|uniref:hypothetical protein n=1 Tax=Mesorhizobium sp. LjNodule214 TaxID=3342252 RepID=UPI003ECD4277